MAATSEMHEMNGTTGTPGAAESAEIVAGRVWEEVVRFGPDAQLLGILSRPALLSPDKPAIVILNAGVLHRVGPHRFHVRLARHLAERGLATVRLDLSGIGDSPASGHTGTFMESAVADVQAVMSALERRGVRSFVLLGLCSGADNSFAAALEDARVRGIVLLDPHSYATRRSQARKVLQRAAAQGRRDTVRWLAGVAVRQLRAAVERRLASLRPAAPGAEPDSGGRRPPPRAQLRADLQRLVERGIKVLAVYSGALAERYNDRDQLFELFPELRGKVDREYFPQANHMFTERAAQTALLETVAPWILRHFG